MKMLFFLYENSPTGQVKYLKMNEYWLEVVMSMTNAELMTVHTL